MHNVIAEAESWPERYQTTISRHSKSVGEDCVACRLDSLVRTVALQPPVLLAVVLLILVGAVPGSCCPSHSTQLYGSLFLNALTTGFKQILYSAAGQLPWLCILNFV
jgi:hypothetical protein